jgi:small GTP-binding protein
MSSNTTSTTGDNREDLERNLQSGLAAFEKLDQNAIHAAEQAADEKEPDSSRVLYDNAVDRIKKLLDDKTVKPEERKAINAQLEAVQEYSCKLDEGEVRIAVFGLINCGKSSLLNALAGKPVFETSAEGGVDPKGKTEIWEPAENLVSGLDRSRAVLVDTPGICEPDHTGSGKARVRAEEARATALKADLVLYVVGNDITEPEMQAIKALRSAKKPMILVFNQVDRYTAEQRSAIRAALEKRIGQFRTDNYPLEIVETAAAPNPQRVMRELIDGTWEEFDRPGPPQIDELRVHILDLLAESGKELLVANTLLQVGGLSEEVVAKRLAIRRAHAERIVRYHSILLGLAVGVNPLPGVDIAGVGVDTVAMIVQVAHAFNYEFSKKNAVDLFKEVAKHSAIMTVGETVLHVMVAAINVTSLGIGYWVTAAPQGLITAAMCYFRGYIAMEYFAKGKEWGHGGIKRVIGDAIQHMKDKNILKELADELAAKLKGTFSGKAPQVT